MKAWNSGTQTLVSPLNGPGPLLAPGELRRYALRVVDAADPDGPEPIQEQLQQQRRYLELNNARTACGSCKADSPPPSVPSCMQCWIRWPGAAAAASKTSTAPPSRSPMSGPPRNGSTTRSTKAAADC
jgi:hypothetical protein